MSGAIGMRTVVLGASGNFGSRIVRALASDPALEVIAASRRAGRVDPALGVPAAALDLHAPDFEEQLHALAPQLLIHCAGPFQGQGYRVAQAALAAGAHYLDLADGRDFVAGFAAANHEAAQAARRLAICGASTLPALSSAVIEALSCGLARIRQIEIAIAPGQRSPRGTATMEAVLSYLGQPFRWKRNGRWERAWGWQQLRRIGFDVGTRWAAACDVPDLELLPQRYPGVASVSFHAALEMGSQHLALWLLAGLRRAGASFAVEAWARRLDRAASLLERFGGEQGAMRVSIVGADDGATLRRRTWQLSVAADRGRQIPCMASVLLARKLARGQMQGQGAYPCMGFLNLSDFEPEFGRWAVRTRIEEAHAVRSSALQ